MRTRINPSFRPPGCRRGVLRAAVPGRGRRGVGARERNDSKSGLANPDNFFLPDLGEILKFFIGRNKHRSVQVGARAGGGRRGRPGRARFEPGTLRQRSRSHSLEPCAFLGKFRRAFFRLDSGHCDRYGES